MLMVLASLVDHHVNMCGLIQLDLQRVVCSARTTVLALATLVHSHHHLWETTTTANQAIQITPLHVNSTQVTNYGMAYSVKIAAVQALILLHGSVYNFPPLQVMI